MPRVALLHWKSAEAAPYTEALAAAGHHVVHVDNVASWRSLRDNLPETDVIHLGRLPSHGREVGVALRSSGKTRHVPIVFVDGEAEKVAAIKAVLPDAEFTTLSKLGAAVKRALRNPPTSPVKPVSMMDRFSHRTAAQKLGAKDGSSIGVIDPPDDYERIVGGLPDRVSFVENKPGDVTLWFIHGPTELQRALPKMARIAASTKLWALWRKGGVDGVTDNAIREGAISVGMVDYKVCSVNQSWSGYALAAKKRA